MTERNRALEFRAFLNLINRSVTEDLRWLLRHPRFTLHFTLTYSSWINLVERRFAELTNKWLRRGTHRSTKELEASINTWVDKWNDDPTPFVWHKSADEILDTLATYCARTSDSGH
jgi:transposase